METLQSYGKNLPDQVDRISNVFDAHLTLINDVRDLYRDRAALEREYATRLQALVKKATEKKVRCTSLLVVGDDPTKAWDESTLKRSTLDSAYSGIINSMANSAQDHSNLADAISSQVVDPLKVVEKRNEESKKKQIQFFNKMLSDRDRMYSERIKSKQKYDEECLEIEAHRQKQGRAQDDKHVERAVRALEQQRVDMLNRKNLYLISVNIANKTKQKFFDDDLPCLEDIFQDLQTRLVDRFVKILLHAQALQTSHQDVLKSRVATVESAFGQVNPAKDQDLFINYNIRPFNAPADWVFEPCTSHYDTGEMSVEPAPKVFLQNKLIKCQAKLSELAPLIDAKRRDVEQFTKLVHAYANNRSLGDSEEVMDNYLEAKQQLISFTSLETILNAEIETISAALGDDVGGNQPHTFKSSSFSIPTQCGYCKTSIWGLSKQGMTCKLCGISVHSKCELKIPADCTGSRGTSKASSTLPRTYARGSSTSDEIKTPTPSSFIKSEVTSHVTYPPAQVLFDFTATSPFELSVSGGMEVDVLEEDDGSGWVKVSDRYGGKGLVPASYIELGNAVEHTPEPTVARAPAARQQGSGQYVRAVYPYQPQGSDEIGFAEGESIELSAGPSGGQNYADGWWEGFDSKGRKGIFPSNYVEIM